MPADRALQWLDLCEAVACSSSLKEYLFGCFSLAKEPCLGMHFCFSGSAVVGVKDSRVSVCSPGRCCSVNIMCRGEKTNGDKLWGRIYGGIFMQ